MRKLTLPREIDDLDVIASVSTGKDSTALMLALLEAEIPFSAVFADTGWEADETYVYLEYLRRKIGPIDVVRSEHGGLVDHARSRARFPARLQRWCTRKLKIEPLRKYHDDHEERTGNETVCAVGIRASESKARSKLPVLEDEPAGSRSWGGWIWRPLLMWSIQDVLEIHRRHGVPVHPLYQRGHSRVGCYPCIMANKEEIRLIAEHAPQRIDEIRDLENELTQIRTSRNDERPGRYSHPEATFFLTRGIVGRDSNIDTIVSWSRTSHGGRQFQLLAPAPKGGVHEVGALRRARRGLLSGLI